MANIKGKFDDKFALVAETLSHSLDCGDAPKPDSSTIEVVTQCRFKSYQENWLRWYTS